MPKKTPQPIIDEVIRLRTEGYTYADIEILVPGTNAGSMCNFLRKYAPELVTRHKMTHRIPKLAHDPALPVVEYKSTFVSSGFIRELTLYEKMGGYTRRKSIYADQDDC